MAKLTKRTVEAIKSNTRAVVAWDDELSGFGVRVYPSGRRVYFLQYRVGGGRGGTARKPSIGVHGNITADQARTTARRWLAEVADGGDPGGERDKRRKAPTVAELADKYLEDHARPNKKPSGAHGDERMIILHVKPRLGTKKVADIKTADIDRTLAAVEAGRVAEDMKIGKRGHAIVRGGPYAANRARALLSKMFNLADRWGMRPDHTNPVKYARKFKEYRRERFLTPDELKRLGKVLAAVEAEGSVSPAAVAAIRLLIFTGCRVGEIRSLQWSHVDFDHACLRLPDSKTGAKVVYLSAPALEVLAPLAKVEGNPYVLPGIIEGQPLSDLKGSWGRIRKRADLANVRLHDLRHSFASVAATAGVPLLVIGRLLGHSQIATTERYAHLAADRVRQAAETTASTLAASLSGKPGGEVMPLPSRRRNEGG